MGTFVDAAYALMVRTYAALPGTNLLEAVERTNESFGLEKSAEVAEASIKARNQASMEKLTGMMRGVK